MSMERRLALLEWAQTVNATIIEDDSGSEFRYGGISLDPLHRLDNTGRVAYVGSFSKALLPTLRLGFIVPPASLKAALRKAKYVSDWHTAVPMQAALARFITEGLFARHVRRMREIYAKRHYEIRAVLEDLLDHRLQPLPSAGGLHLAALLLPHRYDDRVIADLAHAAGVGIQPISQFAVHTHSSPGLVIGYGGIRIDQIRPGLTRLRSVLDAAP